MTVEYKETSTRTLTLPVPSDCRATEQLGKWLANNGQEGYSLTGAVEINGGDQRDPYVIGLRLTVTK